MRGSAAGNRTSLAIRGTLMDTETKTQKADGPIKTSQWLTPTEPMKEDPLNPSVKNQLLQSDEETVTITSGPELQKVLRHRKELREEA